ncbi:MAG: magnesium protoporphyrin IX methyltransferase [Hyphomicrobium sp.]|nr:magnesium protoporphyrin IX methyltransferase [Hyphomicrobium sp.]
MHTLTYSQRKSELRTYFDKTAASAWERLTSEAPVSRIRATVRAGRDRMRTTLLAWLPENLEGRRILDAGCGTGALSIEAARRGAEVVAIDIAPTLVELAKGRAAEILGARAIEGRGAGTIQFLAGDMLDPSLGRFDHAIAMDSLIHYRPADMVAMVGRLATVSGSSVLFTFAPRTPALTMMHTVGRFFPRHDRAPAIEPVDAGFLRRHLASEPALLHWRADRSLRIDSHFYTSQAMEMMRA